MKISFKYKIFKNCLKWHKKVTIKLEFHFIVCSNKFLIYLKRIMLIS